MSRNKRIRTESGQIISSSHKTSAYEEWKKKSKTEIQREGEIEKVSNRGSSLNTWKRDHQFKHKGAPKKEKKEKGKTELKSTEEILKARKVKAKMAEKNKPKKKRKARK